MKKKFIFSFLILVLSLVSVGCGNEKTAGTVKESEPTSESKSNSSSTSSSDETNPLTTKQTTIPTLFIHGYSGTEGSFRGMLSRFETNGWGKKVLTVTVQPDGSVSDTGTWDDQSTNPLVQVLFADNKNNEWNQADWIKATVVYLKQTYQIEELNLVGHSMGGVSSFRYLVTYGEEDSLPAVNKFVAIGAPFNDFVTGNEEQSLDTLIQDGPLVISQRYSDFTASIQQYPQKTPLLNIAGDVQDGSDGDGTVPMRSVLSIGHLMQTNGIEYHEEIITGSQAYHSQLHENTQVDELIANFLWDRP